MTSLVIRTAIVVVALLLFQSGLASAEDKKSNTAPSNSSDSPGISVGEIKLVPHNPDAPQSGVYYDQNGILRRLDSSTPSTPSTQTDAGIVSNGGTTDASRPVPRRGNASDDEGIARRFVGSQNLKDGVLNPAPQREDLPSKARDGCEGASLEGSWVRPNSTAPYLVFERIDGDHFRLLYNGMFNTSFLRGSGARTSFVESVNAAAYASAFERSVNSTMATVFTAKYEEFINMGPAAKPDYRQFSNGTVTVSVQCNNLHWRRQGVRRQWYEQQGNGFDEEFDVVKVPRR